MERKQHTIDATDKAIGRVATEAATFLRGKHKPEYVPYKDLGDIVEVKNVNKVKFTGKKIEQKRYYKYSGYPGGLKETKIADLEPAEMLRRAVRDMLPPTKLRDGMLKRLIIR